LATGLLLLGSLLASAQSTTYPLVSGVAAIDMTVFDVDRAVTFYSGVLSFRKVSNIEVAGQECEHLEGVFGIIRMRAVRMQLGDEFIELTEYLAPKGRPIPRDARNSDRTLQHIAIIVSDMDRAYRRLRQNSVELASSDHNACPTGTRTRRAFRRSTSRAQMSTC
jgi:catechol 2,3-dioxygenase-like lactoylglutathione lyase family enzyme